MLGLALCSVDKVMVGGVVRSGQCWCVALIQLPRGECSMNCLVHIHFLIAACHNSHWDTVGALGIIGHRRLLMRRFWMYRSLPLYGRSIDIPVALLMSEMKRTWRYSRQ